MTDRDKAWLIELSICLMVITPKGTCPDHHNLVNITMWNFPKSERTIVNHKWEWNGLSFKNDLGHPCHYRVLQNGKELGMVQYYKGRLLQVLGLKGVHD